MQISVSDAKARLTELGRRAEAGDKIVLTRHGRPVARFVPIKAAQERTSRLNGVRVDMPMSWTSIPPPKPHDDAGADKADPVS